MENDKAQLKKNDYLFLISLVALGIFPILFVLRSLDDNRLTNWLWAFQYVRAENVFVILCVGVILSFILSEISIPRVNTSYLLFIISFLSAMLFWHEPEVLVDASRYFTQAKHLEVYGISYFIDEWGRNINAWTDMPLIPFLYGLIFMIFGEVRIYIQIFTTTLFSLSVVLTYLTGKTLWNEEIGLFGGVLLLGIPYLFTQVPLMLVDVPTMFFLILSVFAFIKAIELGGFLIVLSAVSLVCTFFSKYSTWPMLSVIFVIFLVYIIRNPDRGKKYLYRGSWIFIIAGLLIGGVFCYKWDSFVEQIRLLVSYQKPGLKRWGESAISTFFFQIHPMLSVSALYSFFVAAKKRDLRFVIVSWLAILVFLIQINRIRYIIMVFPMFSLMASYGLSEIRERSIVKFISLCIVISSLSVSFFVFRPFLNEMSAVNLRDAGKYLDSLEEKFVEVFTLEPPKDPVSHPSISVPILDYFTRKMIIYTIRDDSFLQPLEKIKESSLRFTWEYRNPSYYVRGATTEEKSIVVISEKSDDDLPVEVIDALKGYYLTKEFSAYEGIFQLRTSVRVYRK